MSGPTREQVLQWARQVGMAGMITDVVTTLDEIQSLAALAYAAGQAAEREACAKVCDDKEREYIGRGMKGFWSLPAALIAIAIRARGTS